ncbi:hypothetical protein MHH52_02725 [Paenibacillus sp. FSL K6-0276]
MHGQKNEQADISPEASAGQIVNLVLEYKKYLGEEPAYLDLFGSSWPW